MPASFAEPLKLVPARCAACGADDAAPVAVGEDFEYRTSPDTFLAVRCRRCGLVYLDPRPAGSEFERIYPPEYHAFAFEEEAFGFVHTVRQRLERNRLARWIGPAWLSAGVLDVGCGDGFHLKILRDAGSTGRLAGIELDERAAARARERGLDVVQGRIETLQSAPGEFDIALLIQTIEHVEEPAAVLRAIATRLRPGGRLIVVTDNTASLDRTAFAGRHWGGYHFPRHLALFNAANLTRLADRCGFRAVALRTIASPVNWVYSLRNALVDYGAPKPVYERFSLSAVPALAFFTVVDALAARCGRGALLNAIFERR